MDPDAELDAAGDGDGELDSPLLEDALPDPSCWASTGDAASITPRATTSKINRMVVVVVVVVRKEVQRIDKWQGGSTLPQSTLPLVGSWDKKMRPTQRTDNARWVVLRN